MSASVTTKFQPCTNGVIATLTISNPTKFNCLSTVILNAIQAQAHALSQREDLRLVIVTGGECVKGNAFVAGADIAELAAISTPAEARKYITGLHLACQALRDIPVPVIGRVNGHALGGGLIIMTSTDMRVAASDATFGMPEVLRGVPSTVESALLPAAVGSLRARRLLLLGDAVGAIQAEQWGLVDRVVPREQLDAAVDEWTQMLLRSGPEALKGQKALIRTWDQLTPQLAAIEAGIWQFGKAFEGGHNSEGSVMTRRFVDEQKARKSKL